MLESVTPNREESQGTGGEQQNTLGYLSAG